MDNPTPVALLDIEFPDASGRTFAERVTLLEAAERFQQTGLMVIRGASDKTVFRTLGNALLGPMNENPNIRKGLDIFEWEKKAGLAKYDLFRAVAASKAMDVLRQAWKTDTLVLHEQNFHAPRIQRPIAPDEGLPFHQDGGLAGEIMTRGWFLLYPETCGETAPNIEFVISDVQSILPIEQTPESAIYGRLEMSHAVRDKLLAENARWRPTVGLGDVLLFRGIVPHRTHFPPDGKIPRLSLETSIFPASDKITRYILDRSRHGALLARPDYFEAIRRVKL